MKLSKREKQIMRLVAKGEPDKSIADRLTISAHTVNNHLRRIYRKMQVNCRAFAAVRFCDSFKSD